MEIVSKVMEKSWKFVGKNVYEPWYLYAKTICFFLDLKLVFRCFGEFQDLIKLWTCLANFKLLSASHRNTERDI